MNSADSGNGGRKLTPKCCAAFSSRVSAFQRRPPGPMRTTSFARSQVTAAEKFTRIGVTGRHGALRCSRSQLKSTLNAGRTRNCRRCGSVVATPEAAATPLPHTSVTTAPCGNGRCACTISRGPGESQRPRAARIASRSAPVMMRAGMRSPMPCTSNQTCWRTVAGIGSASRSSRNACASSMPSPPPRDGAPAGSPASQSAECGARSRRGARRIRPAAHARSPPSPSAPRARVAAAPPEASGRRARSRRSATETSRAAETPPSSRAAGTARR